jgi:hypothetical protein
MIIKALARALACVCVGLFFGFVLDMWFDYRPVTLLGMGIGGGLGWYFEWNVQSLNRG